MFIAFTLKFVTNKVLGIFQKYTPFLIFSFEIAQSVLYIDLFLYSIQNAHTSICIVKVLYLL